MSHPAIPPAWEPPAHGEILRWPLPFQGAGNRWLVRALAMLARRQVLSISGLEHVRPNRDPFILALSHGTRSEALLVPALLVLARGGRIIHFLADWNFRLIPGVGLIYRRGEAITLTRKPARPRILNLLKPLYRHPVPAWERASAQLARGRSIGVFPEGTVNRDPRRLLAGRRGAARLSLETGVPIVPVGIRYPRAPRDAPISDHAAMTVDIGAPLCPRGPMPMASLDAVRAWHAVMMRDIARLSGRTWSEKLSGSLTEEIGDEHA